MPREPERRSLYSSKELRAKMCLQVARRSCRVTFASPPVSPPRGSYIMERVMVCRPSEIHTFLLVLVFPPFFLPLREHGKINEGGRKKASRETGIVRERERKSLCFLHASSFTTSTTSSVLPAASTLKGN